MAIAARVDPETRVPVGPWPVGPFTWDDVQEFPDEAGLRYELIDGILLMSPAPSPLHQRVIRELLLLLVDTCPADHEAFPAPFDWFVTDWRYFEPDVLVVPRIHGNPRRFEGTPLLAVEVLSPSTRHRDLGLKKTAYAEAGLEHYWVVDPDPDAPSLSAFRLGGGHLVESATVTGDAAYEAGEPFPVRIVPAELVAGGPARGA